MSKPSIPKGTRDFGPSAMARRNYIFDTIRASFERYGFLPIETPAMENLATLTGKYGEEGDQLIFKILNNGDFLTKADADALAAKDSKKLGFSISKKALRYDLTVPFARFVVMHQNDIAFPFRRYQIQPVWRGDRPGKGRYQEFFQCDADIIGTNSLVCEVELVQLFDEVLSNLRIPDFSIKINNRKILAGLAEVAGVGDLLTDMTVALDKLDKIGAEKVMDEMRGRGISEDSIAKLQPLLELGTDTEANLQALAGLLAGNETGEKGIEELRYVLAEAERLGLRDAKLEFDPTLARGLNYYTGAIFEVKANGVGIGSICGGGRYDDLTGIFGLKGMSGVGISFGADRIYDVLEELDLFPADATRSTELLYINFGSAEQGKCLEWLTAARKAGVRAEVYPSSAKLKKQMQYANDKSIPWVVLAGSQEIEQGVVTLKHMESGEQETLSPEAVFAKLRP